MKKLIFIAIAGAAFLLASCSGGNSSSSTPLFGSLAGEYAKFAEKKAEIQEKAKTISTEKEKAELIEESQRIEEEWSVKIENAAKALDGKPVEVESVDFTITEPITLTFDGIYNKSDIEPKFKVSGSIEAANEINTGDYILPKRIVNIVGYDAEGNKLYDTEIGTIAVTNQDGQGMIAAGTQVELTTIRFSDNNVEEYLKATTLKIELK